MNKSTGFGYIYLTLILLLGLSYTPLFLEEKLLDAFVREDNILETLTAIYYFIASILSIIAYYRSMRSPFTMTHTFFKKLSYLGLAFFFILSAGEEISWGQRIFKFENPSIINEINYQEEFNLHNMKYFQGEESLIPFSLSQVFTLIWILYALIIPISAYLNSNIDRFLRKYIPLIPVPLGLLFLINYGFQKFFIRFLPKFPNFYLHPSMPIPQGIHEIREHGVALVYVVAVSFITFIKLNPTRPLTHQENQGKED